MQPPYDRVVHHVQILNGTLLHSVLDCSVLGVNSYHHQAVRSIGSGVEICAVSEDGLIEGIELTEYSFALGVQWHPEMRSDTASGKIISELVCVAMGV